MGIFHYKLYKPSIWGISFILGGKSPNIPFVTTESFHSMDWFKNKSSPETIDFPVKIMGFKPVNFPSNWDDGAVTTSALSNMGSHDIFIPTIGFKDFKVMICGWLDGRSEFFFGQLHVFAAPPRLCRFFLIPSVAGRGFKRCISNLKGYLLAIGKSNNLRCIQNFGWIPCVKIGKTIGKMDG